MASAAELAAAVSKYDECMIGTTEAMEETSKRMAQVLLHICVVTDNFKCNTSSATVCNSASAYMQSCCAQATAASHDFIKQPAGDTCVHCTAFSSSCRLISSCFRLNCLQNTRCKQCVYPLMGLFGATLFGSTLIYGRRSRSWPFCRSTLIGWTLMQRAQP